MNQRKIFSILLFVIVSISSCGMLFTSLTGDMTKNGMENTNTIDNDLDSDNPTNIYEDNEKLQPDAAAYYRDLVKTGEYLVDATGTGGSDMTIKASTQNSTHIFLTGYTTISGNRSLTIISIKKSDNTMIKRTLRSVGLSAPLDSTYNTMGLTIAIDDSKQFLLIGGAYDLNNSVTLSYETYGAGILVAYNSSTMSFLWCMNLSNTLECSNGDIDPQDFFKPWHFGGERIEDIYGIGGGNFLITGAYSFKQQFLDNLNQPFDAYAVNAFRARVNYTGGLIWNYQEEKILYEDPSYDEYFASVGKKIIYNPISDKYFILVDEKISRYGPSYNNEGTIQSCIFAFNPITGAKLDYPNNIIGLNSRLQLPNIHYELTIDIAVDSTGIMWAFGENRSISNININRTRILYKLNQNGQIYADQTWYISGLNYTAKDIIIDQNNTMYFFGESLNNNTNQVAYWYYNLYDIYRIGQPMYHIESNLDATGTNGYIANAIFDSISMNITITATTYNTPQGIVKNYASGLTYNIGNLTPLPQYTNTPYVYLNWTMSDSRAKYYYVFRNTSSIEPEDIPYLTPITKKEWINQYIDSIPSPIDGMIYYYAILTGTDANNASTISTSSIQYYKNPDKPIIELNPSSKILAGNLFQIKTKYFVANATLKLFGQKGIFTAGNIPFMNPITTSTNGTINYYMSINSTGTWYFMILAENSSRGNITSDPVPFSVENIATSPISLDVEEQYRYDGEVDLSWSRTLGVEYNIYVKSTKFTSRDFAQISGLTPINTEKITTNEYKVTGLSSGTYYFAIHGTNSSGNATDIAYTTETVTITLIPRQPELIITTQFNNDGVNQLLWTETPETSYYLIYRAYSEIDSVLCETDVNTMTLVYNGTGLSKTDVVQEEGYYFYAVIAVNVNGQRKIDCSLGAIAVVAWENKPNMNLYYGLIAGGSIFAVVMVIYGVYKKNNPY